MLGAGEQDEITPRLVSIAIVAAPELQTSN